MAGRHFFGDKIDCTPLDSQIRAGKHQTGTSCVFFNRQPGLEIRPFLHSGTAKICAGMVRFVISHSDELANLRLFLDKGHF